MAHAAKSISVFDAVAIIIGIVIGAGIFKTPSIVAASAGSGAAALFFWLCGGLISLIGALCYAEMASAYPDAGGDYFFITRAFGRSPAFLFAWARMTVIQAGSIAMLAFLVGDYASELLRLGAFSPSIYAGIVIAALTAVNIAGIQPGSGFQDLLMLALVTGLAFVAGAGLTAHGAAAPASASAAAPSPGSAGKAMIFVLLTYGGWNEAAYLSSEVKDVRRNMFRVLFISIGVITLAYLAINGAYFRGLGLERVARSDAVAADLMRSVLGEPGARFISLLIALAAFSTMNGMIITGARTNYALGRDFRLFSFLGRWDEQGGTPVNALIVQGAVALALVLLGTTARSGFQMMVEYTAPVFWFFLFLAGLSLFVLRRRDPHRARPFRVPLYPLTPALFCAVALYMLFSSLLFVGTGALIGAAVLAAGVPLLVLKDKGEAKP